MDKKDEHTEKFLLDKLDQFISIKRKETTALKNLIESINQQNNAQSKENKELKKK